MLPRDLLGPSPVARPAPANAVEALADPRQQAFQRSLASQVGQPMRAQVLARLADGSAIVRVNDTPARMMLPPGAEVGSEVPLRLVAVYPRPTFEYGAGKTLIEASPAHPPDTPGPPRAAEAEAEAAVFTPHEDADAAALVYRPDGRGPAAAGTASSGAAATQQAAGTAQASALAAQAARASGDPGATLSPAGQVLGSVLAAVLKLEQPARAVTARVPVLAAPSKDAAALAPALRQALEQSGLFYESHVAAWAEGRRELATLAHEPQMQDRPVNPADPEPAQLINLQLGAQEQDSVAWQGQLWPGQAMQWEISRDAPQQERGQPGEVAEPAWQSRLKLRFPLFGDIDATVVLHGGQVAIRVALDDADGAALLRSHTAALEGALAAAGTPLSALSIVDGGAHE